MVTELSLSMSLFQTLRFVEYSQYLSAMPQKNISKHYAQTQHGHQHEHQNSEFSDHVSDHVEQR
jgi:hypothetical protein